MTMQSHERPEEGDDTILRVTAALKQMPPADPYAVARVLSAVHGRTPQPTPRWREIIEWMRTPSLSVAGATALVAVALFAGYMAKGQLQTEANPIANRGVESNSATNAVTPAVASAPTPASETPAAAVSATAASATASVPLISAASVDDAERAVPVQFVLDLPSAHTVSVVGDFNDWTVDQAPMQKFANGAWSITLPVKPGRHEYAFVVDGTKWMADPRAPKARDRDFDKPGSVMLVTKP